MSVPGKLLRWLFFIVWCVVASYALLEALYSALYVHGKVPGFDDEVFHLNEDKGGVFHFDPVLGYRLDTTPARHLKYSYGRIEYATEIAGNNVGFHDPSDWGKEKDSPGQTRIAVLGDSFTAAPFLETAWTERVEELAGAGGLDWELMNLGLNGGGILNWWSVINRFLGPEGYQFDAMVFAVYDWDFDRSFYIADDTPHAAPPELGLPDGVRAFWSGYLPWRPADEWPTSIEEARAYLRPTPNMYVAPPAVFDRALRGSWHPDVPRPWKPYVLTFAPRIWSALTSPKPELAFRRDLSQPPFEAPEVQYEFQPGVELCIRDMVNFLEMRGIPCFVARITGKEEIAMRYPPQPTTLKFAHQVASAFYDGVEAFEPLDAHGLEEAWFTYDYHWAQEGSDRFARAFYPLLREWMSEPDALPERDGDGRVALWRQVVARYPEHGYGHSFLARALHENGEIGQAIARVQTALEKNVAQAHRLHLLLGEWRGETGELDGARQAFLAALEANPEFTRAYAMLERLLKVSSTEGERLAFWRNRCEAMPDAFEPRYRLARALEDAERFDEAGQAYLDAIGIESRREAVIGRFDLLLAREEYNGALQFAQEMQQREPEQAEWVWLEGQAMRARGETAESLPVYQRAVEVDPSFMPAHYAIDSVFGAMDMANAKLAYWNDQVERRPGQGRLHFHQGKALMEQGAHEEARDAFSRALELSWTSNELLAHLAHAERALGNHEAALALYRKVLYDNPNDREACEGLDLLLREMGGDGERLAEWKRLTAEYPVVYLPHIFIGMVHQENERWEAAEEAFEKSLEVYGHFDAFLRLGAVRARLGRFEDALAPLRQAVALEPSVRGSASHALYLAGRNLLAKGDWDRAMAAFAHSISFQERARHEAAQAVLDHALRQESPENRARALRQVLAFDPEEGKAQIELLTSLFGQGQWEEAREVYFEFVTLEAARREIGQRLIAPCEELLDAGAYGEARNRLRLALEFEVKSELLLETLIRAEAGLGNYAEAMAVYWQMLGEAIDIKPVVLAMDALTVNMSPASRPQLWAQLEHKYPEEAPKLRPLELAEVQLPEPEPIPKPAEAAHHAAALPKEQVEAALWETKTADELAQEGDWEHAIEKYVSALEQFPNSLDIHMKLADAYRHMGKVDEAVRVYFKASDLAPHYAKPYAEADYLLSTHKDNAVRLRLWEGFVEEHPNNAPAHAFLAEARLEAQDRLGAIRAFRKAGAYERRDTGLIRHVAYRLVDLGDWAGASRPLRRIAGDMPEWDRETYPNLALALVKSGEYEAAREAAARCKELNVPIPQEVVDELAAYIAEQDL